MSSRLVKVIVCPLRSGRKGLIMTMLLSGLVWPAVAQEAPFPESGDSPESMTLQEVDETALRYFARLGDQRRLEAEIARLQALYPGWVPPANPLSADDPANDEIQALWDLYGTGDIDGVEAAIGRAPTTGTPTPSGSRRPTSWRRSTTHAR